MRRARMSTTVEAGPDIELTTPSYRKVTVWGHEVRVAIRRGTGDGPPLVLCNGIGASLDLLRPFVDQVDKSIEVVSFDVPGTGGSPSGIVPYNFPLLAAGLRRMLTKLQYDEVNVLGISWGGALAQQFAFQNPNRCQKAVLCATATGSIMVPASPRVLAKMVTPRRYRDKEYAKQVAAELYGGYLREHPEEIGKFMHDHSRVGSRRGYVMQLLAGSGWSSIPGLPFIKQPTLIMAGKDDPIIPLINAKIMQKLIPNSTLHVYEDGHLGLVTMADKLGPCVSDFLRD